jgi:formate--tetrahydrofolate ligase
VTSSIVEAFTKGGAGAADLARTVVTAIEENPEPNVQPVYNLSDTLEEKIRKVATSVYGAAGVAFSDKARARLGLFAEWGHGGLPVCIAKTQYSLTDNPRIAGAPTGWTLNVTDASLSAGAGFVVAIAGNMMLMPGLPHDPRALAIDVDEDGNITGV